MMEIYQQQAPSLISKLEEKFPWHLRYYWLVMILLVLASLGVSFLIGYALEPEEEVKY